MKKLIALMMVLCLACSLVACASAPEPKTAQDFSQIITENRDQEWNDNLAVMGLSNGEPLTMLTNPTGLSDTEAADQCLFVEQNIMFDLANCETAAFSISMMMVQAYGVGIFTPTQGNTDAVRTSIENFVALQQQNFDGYLPDQYELTLNAEIRETKSGDLLLVLCENAAEVADAMEAALNA